MRIILVNKDDWFEDVNEDEEVCIPSEWETERSVVVLTTEVDGTP